MSGEGHQDFGRALAPSDVVRGTAAGDGSEQQHQIILANQLFGRRSVAAQADKYLERLKVKQSKYENVGFIPSSHCYSCFIYNII